jgi:hypothetical protein
MSADLPAKGTCWQWRRTPEYHVTVTGTVFRLLKLRVAFTWVGSGLADSIPLATFRVRLERCTNPEHLREVGHA